jgi:hypothetical protein
MSTANFTMLDAVADLVVAESRWSWPEGKYSLALAVGLLQRRFEHLDLAKAKATIVAAAARANVEPR